MNVVYGKYDRSPHWYDAVIPNYFDREDFEFNATPKDYFLFVGRLIESKGVGIAIETTKRLGVKLILAGQGNLADIVNPVPDHVVHIGYVEPKQRSELMRNAKALLAPTHYNEPFGGVTIEALFCGTPTITTDWGGFAENNVHGVTGYRCRTIEQFVWAAKNIDKISRKACYDWAINNFSLERVALMYEEYFKTLIRIHDGSGGFYSVNDERDELDWLKRTYPVIEARPSSHEGVQEVSLPTDATGPHPMLIENMASLSLTTPDHVAPPQTEFSPAPKTRKTNAGRPPAKPRASKKTQA